MSKVFVRPLILIVGLLAAVLPASAAADDSVSVVLAEFTVTPDKASVAAGQIDFTLNNLGSVPHNLVVVRTDLAADALPVDIFGVVVESTLDIQGRIAQFTTANGPQTLSLDLSAGSYVLYCSVGLHYSEGMNIAFEVGDVVTTSAPVPPASGNAGIISGSGSSPLLLATLAVLAITLVVGARVVVGRR